MENSIPKEITQEVVAMSGEAETMLTVAKDFKIANAEEYTGAVTQLKAIKAKAKELEETRKSITGPMDDAKKRVMDFFRKPLQFLADAEAVIKRGMIAYDTEQEKKRREEEARLQELARKEQERLEKAAEKKAEKAEAKGNTERAAEIRESVPVVAMPTVAVARPKVEGIARRSTWSGEVVDKMALIKAVAAGKAPATLLAVNQTALNQMARALKDELSYPGVKAVETQQIAA